MPPFTSSRRYRVYCDSAKPSENKAARHACREFIPTENSRLRVSSGEIFSPTRFVNNLSLSLVAAPPSCSGVSFICLRGFIETIIYHNRSIPTATEVWLSCNRTAKVCGTCNQKGVAVVWDPQELGLGCSSCALKSICGRQWAHQGLE